MGGGGGEQLGGGGGGGGRLGAGYGARHVRLSADAPVPAGTKFYRAP